MKVKLTPLRKRTARRRSAGFTLVELLLVLVILAALAAVVVPKFANRGKQAKVTAATTQISNFEVALDTFEVDNGYYPSGANGLNDLASQPSNAQEWRGPYVKEVPLDPWQNPYIYESPGKMNSGGYDISSSGPDMQPGNEDDITNFSSGGN
ncbi:MAG: general secretion pathway protein G [Candidatus Binatia bacterium]|jgi:general secretion pathway protein G